MKIVGLTGGIGSGKTTVAKLFEKFGIPIYIADDQAKHLMNTSPKLKEKIKTLFGEEAYQNNTLNRSFIASKVFTDATRLEQLNALVHPAVQEHFQQWVTEQDAPYVIKESAILFEHGNHKYCDKTILVTAPKELRIERVQQRDQSSKKQISDRMDKQWSDAQKIPLADYIINNDASLVDVKKEVERIHNEFLLLFS